MCGWCALRVCAVRSSFSSGALVGCCRALGTTLDRLVLGRSGTSPRSPLEWLDLFISRWRLSSLWLASLVSPWAGLSYCGRLEVFGTGRALPPLRRGQILRAASVHVAAVVCEQRS